MSIECLVSVLLCLELTICFLIIVCVFYVFLDVAVVGGGSTMLQRRVGVPTMSQSTTERTRNHERGKLCPRV